MKTIVERMRRMTANKRDERFSKKVFQLICLEFDISFDRIYCLLNSKTMSLAEQRLDNTSSDEEEVIIV